MRPAVGAEVFNKRGAAVVRHHGGDGLGKAAVRNPPA